MVVATNPPERTSDWPHYDATAIAMLAALAPSSQATPAEIAKAAFDFADAMAKEAYLRRLGDPNPVYIISPSIWINQECAPEKLRGVSMTLDLLGKQFLWRYLGKGYGVAETYQGTIDAIETMSKHEEAYCADSDNADMIEKTRNAAVALLMTQI